LYPRSLAGRLVTGVVALVVVTAMLIGSSTYFALRYFLSQRLDQQLDGVSTVQTLNDLGCAASSPSYVRSPQDVWLAVITPAGTVLQQACPGGGSIKPMLVRRSDAEALLQAKTRHPRTLTTTDDQQLRVQSIRVPYSMNGIPQGVGLAVIGLSTRDTEATLGRLILLEVLIGALAVLVAAGLTAWGVRVGLRPLRRVTRTAQEVAAELGPEGTGLERRVPDTETVTEVGQVASSVNRLLGVVQTEFAARVRSEDRMRQFLADASHELRTPLTSIRGYAELSRLQGQSSSAPDDPMRRIEVEGTRMSRLVEDLLVLARGDDEDAVTVREPVDVDTLLGDALASARAAHPDRHFSREGSSGATVAGDRDQLLRLLLNLLNNAAVHTDPSGSIELESARSWIGAQPAATIRVIDHGPGLPADEAAHVFERFWRADKARSRARGGSGLGMAIVAQIAAAHHGSVSFDSTVEGGTTVAVTLPVFGTDAEPAAASNRLTPHSPPRPH
jgi:two-component system OmpR family sensor kinase